MPALTGGHLPLSIGLTCARCPRLVPARRKRFYDGRSDRCGGGGTARPVRTAPAAPARPAGIPSNKTIRTASSNRNSLGSREVNSKTSSAKKRAKATPRTALRKPTITRSLHRVKRIPVPAPTTAPMIIKSRIVPSQGEAGRAIRKNATVTTVIEVVLKTITSDAVRCPIRLGREISGLFSVAPTSNSEPFFECHQIAPDPPLWSFRGGGRPLLFGSCRWSSRRGEQNDSQDLHREAGNYDNNPVRLIRTRSRIEEDDRAHRKQEGTYKKAHKPAEFASFARSLTRPSGREGQTRIERYRSVSWRSTASEPSC